MSNQYKDEHRKIAEFTRDVVFPEIDAYNAAQRPTLNTESGVLIMLAQRMVQYGFSPDMVTNLVRSATMMEQERAAPTTALTTANVVPFPKGRT